MYNQKKYRYSDMHLYHTGILVTSMLVNNIDKIYECIIKEIQVFMYASP